MPGLVGLLRACGRSIATVSAPVDTAQGFAKCWAASTGGRWRVRFEMTLHRLSALLEPAVGPVGAARMAGPADIASVQALWLKFDHEVGFHHPEASLAAGATRVNAGRVTLWVIAERPVGLAARTAPAASVIRIGPVYTPPTHRERGIGAAVTAAATRSAVAEADAVVLFTDSTNPTSNALYRRLAYLPVAKRTELAFDGAYQ